MLPSIGFKILSRSLSKMMPARPSKASSMIKSTCTWTSWVIFLINLSNSNRVINISRRQKLSLRTWNTKTNLLRVNKGIEIFRVSRELQRLVKLTQISKLNKMKLICTQTFLIQWWMGQHSKHVWIPNQIKIRKYRMIVINSLICWCRETNKMKAKRSLSIWENESSRIV